MVKHKIQWKKAYMDKDGFKRIPIKTIGRKKYRCDDCGKKVKEVFTINPCEILLRRELCRKCYCETPESLNNLLEGFDADITQNFYEELKKMNVKSIKDLANLKLESDKKDV